MTKHKNIQNDAAMWPIIFTSTFNITLHSYLYFFHIPKITKGSASKYCDFSVHPVLSNVSFSNIITAQ